MSSCLFQLVTVPDQSRGRPAPAISIERALSSKENPGASPITTGLHPSGGQARPPGGPRAGSIRIEAILLCGVFECMIFSGKAASTLPDHASVVRLGDARQGL